MGVQSFQLLFEEMSHKKNETPFTPRTILLETSVIERESTKKP